MVTSGTERKRGFAGILLCRSAPFCLPQLRMGGALIQKILEEGKEVLCEAKEFILSPQSEIQDFRHFLQNSGYEIRKETTSLCKSSFLLFSCSFEPTAVNCSTIFLYTCSSFFRYSLNT